MSHLRWASAGAAGLVLAVVAAWAAHYIPSGPTSVAATGTVQADPAAAAAGTTGTGSADDGFAEDGETAFKTACGQLLDVVPVSAVARGTAVEITMEFHPVCPEGEWISSSQFQVAIADAGGALLADGSFNLASQRVYVPGYSDPSSRLVARFVTGTAWADPVTITDGITDGTIVVACQALDGTDGSPAADDDVTSATSVTVAAAAPATSSAGTTPAASTERTALDALRRQVREDDPAVSALEGAWIPQLSSKKKGTYDRYDGHTYSLADIYQQFLTLRLRYSNVRLLNSADWQSYTYPGYWVTIAGVPFTQPNQPNGWCNDRHIPPSQCFAKKLVRDGSPDGTTKHR